MDGSTRSAARKFVLIVAAWSFLTGCGDTKTRETVFPQSSEACEELAVKDRYLVQWESGEVTIVRSSLSREDFGRDFVDKNLPFLKRVENDFRIERNDVEVKKLNDVVGSDSSFIDNWGVSSTQAASAWAQGFRGQGVTVAVIDSGLDRTHPQISPNVFVNPGESGTDSRGRSRSSNGIDDDGNGFVDDVSGWDFVDESPFVFDDDSHGTHVSGIVAARHNDTTHKTGYVQGMAPAAKIMPLDFITGPSGFISDGIEAIRYAAQMNVDIINASWGGEACSTILESTIRDLASRDILFVAAAGNDGINIDTFARFPATYDFAHQMTVGMIGTTLMMASRSNYGERSVFVFAPGTDIYSTVPGGSVAAFTGTSMATPSVVGAAALIKSARPSLSATQIKSILGSSVDFSAAYRNETKGRINVARALQQALQQTP